ncbi:MAG: M20/M25/M40 family metallo-hydrolase [Planctomycetota bacterium]
MRVLREPTSPFHEQNVAQIAAELAESFGWGVRSDASGNLMIERQDHAEHFDPSEPGLLLTAHMDHPGFWARRMVDRRTLEASWVGRVPRSYFEGAAVRFVTGGSPAPPVWMAGSRPGQARDYRCGGQPVSGTITEVLRYVGEGERALVRVQVDQDVAPGSIGQWALPGPEVIDGRLYAPAIDDLAGVAALLCVMGELGRDRCPVRPVRFLLTRAEEAGFVGCLGHCREHSASGSRRHDQVVGVEMSMATTVATPGAGPVIRVGDRRSVFDPAVTAGLARVAQRLEADEPGFRYQRRLMPGGTCESTVFQAYWGRTGAVCLAMDHYHNVNTHTRTLDRESIDVGDFVGLVKLLASVARSPEAEPDGDGVDDWLEDLWRRQSPLLEQSSA